MTTDVQTLRTLLEREQAERDRAMLMFQQAQAHARTTQHQAEQLVAYRSEYHARWKASMGRGQSVQIVSHYHSFSGRLDEAIAQQQRLADDAQARAEHCRHELHALELRVASVSRLIERRLAEFHRHAERREQKHTDEAAARAAKKLWTNSTVHAVL